MTLKIGMLILNFYRAMGGASARHAEATDLAEKCIQSKMMNIL